MRDILAALLRSRGYTHDDQADPYDLHWYGPDLGVRALLSCVAHEINRDTDYPVPGWDTYEVSVAHAPRGLWKAEEMRVPMSSVMPSQWPEAAPSGEQSGRRD